MRKQTIAVFGLFFLYLLVVFQILPLTYAANDDVAMRDIASGAMTGIPDYHLIFVKAVLGVALSTLYAWIPGGGIDWYGCLWMGFIIFSMLLVLWRLNLWCEKKEKNPIVAVIGFLALFTLVVLEHLVNFQFTVVAGIVIGVAIFFYNTLDNKGKTFYLEAALVILMIWLSFCIRTNVVLMAVPFGGLVFLYKNDSVRRKIVMLIIACTGLMAIMVVEHVSYVDEEWKVYQEYNGYRSTIYDYYGVPPYEEHKEFYEEIGLREHDIANLERYSLYFVENLETEKMRQVAEYAEKIYYEQNSLWARVTAGIKCAIKGELEQQNLYLNLFAKLFILFNLIFEFRQKKKSFWINIGFLLCEGLLLFYLGYQGRLPARVGAALLFIELFSALSVFYQDRIDIDESWNQKKWVMGVSFAIVLLLSGNRFVEIQDSQKQIFNKNLQYEQTQSFFEKNLDNVYFTLVQFTSGYSDNFRLQRDVRIGNGFSLGGWSAFSPVRNQGLQYYGIYNVDEAIVEQENVYVILVAPSSKIEAHYKEKYDKITWSKIDYAPVFGMEVPVYKIAEGEQE